MTVPPSTAAALAALALVTVACGAPAPRGPVVSDLVAQFERAEGLRETPLVDVGTPDARAHLGDGWSVDEEWPGGTTGAWSEGDASEVGFYLEAPRELAVGLRGEPYDAGAGRTQVVTVAVNGHRCATLTMKPHLRRYEVAVPASATRAGTNRLHLSYAFTGSPAERDPASPDRRRLAVFWSEVELRGAAPAAPPRARPDTETLVIPPGSRLDYHLDLPGDTVLTLAALAASSGGGALEVRASTEDGPERVLATLRPGAGARAVPLGVPAGIARLSFRHVGPPAAPAEEAALRLVRPLLRAAQPAAGDAPAPAIAGRPPHVFIYLVDALRADRLGVYGYDRPTSPHLDAFAREAAVVEGTFAHSSWTKASVASLLTGLTPFRHGAHDRADALASEVPTLPAILGAAGYRTATIYANAWVGPPWGLDRGFEDARRLYLARSDRIHEEIVSVLDSAAADPRPLFVYVHTIDPHDPYDPPAPQWERFAAPHTTMRRADHDDLMRVLREAGADPARAARRAEELSALYDAEVAANDEQFGRFVSELARRGLLEDSLVVFTSDHGEEFFEHGGLKHGLTLFPEVLHVPLVLRFPGAAGRGARLTGARHVDLLPTILRAAGLPVPESIDGRPIDLAAVSPPGFSLARLQLDGRRLSSLTDGPWHAVWTESPDVPAPRELALYDLRGGAESEVADRHPLRTAFVRGELRLALRRGAGHAVPEVVPSEEALRSLRALGYVQ
jgi:choline-sulfatase